MTQPARRIPLARGRYGIGYTERIYLTEDWLEIDECDGAQVRRFRLPFEDVLLVTRHQARSALLLGFFAVAGALSLLTAMLVASASAGVVLAWAIAGLALLGFAAYLARYPQHVVAAYGERSKARMVFSRAGRAATVHQTVLARVERARRSARGARGELPPSPESAEGNAPAMP